MINQNNHGKIYFQEVGTCIGLWDKRAFILVTTYLSKVATIMGTMSPHKLSMLLEEDGWELFKHQAFGPNEEEQAELVAIGKEIVTSVGECLLQQSTRRFSTLQRKGNEWLYVKENNL